MSDTKRGGNVGQAALVGMAICVAAMLAGCSSTPVEEVVPVSSTPAIVYGTPDAQSADYVTAKGAPQNSGTYPTFSKPLRAANRQLSAQEAGAMRAQMESIANARATGQISESEYQQRLAEMQKLAAEHGPETLREIQN